MKKLILLLLLVGCDLSPDEVRQQIEVCETSGGEPVRMMTLYGKVRRIECW
ncbi:hypothetical protein LCGC14_2669020 [marine sediment metagenome]|uniref:Uncharacterized protein n=1 Tax=marine sediment metagenome TaxID=412755 RepID=A0A0F8ZPN9_9ZZZZ